VKFKVGSTENIYDIKFENGILKIPRVRVRGQIERIFRNLLAFEQCHYIHENYIHDYFFVIDGLIDTHRDVEILEQSGIIESKLTADKQGVANVINNFLAGTTMSATKFYYADLCEAFNVYCSVPWHKWIATLRHDYFTTTWDGLSIIVAAILLILTFIQTLCSIVSI
jgi:hypothetical protein